MFFAICLNVLLCNKALHPDKYLRNNGCNVYGYSLAWNDGSSFTESRITGLTQDEYDSIYIKSNRTKADGMWIAFPSSNGANVLFVAKSGGVVDKNGSYNSSSYGFRPVVCLKSDVKLVDNGNGTCSIQ